VVDYLRARNGNRVSFPGFPLGCGAQARPKEAVQPDRGRTIAPKTYAKSRWRGLLAALSPLMLPIPGNVPRIAHLEENMAGWIAAPLTEAEFEELAAVAAAGRSRRLKNCLRGAP